MPAGTLVITVMRATGLRDSQTFGRQDPYFIVQCGTNHFVSKSATDGGKNPEWNQRFTFELSDERKAFFTIKNKNVLATDDLLGTAEMKFDTAIATGKDDVRLQVVTPGGKVKGELAAILLFTPSQKKDKTSKVPQGGAYFPGASPTAMPYPGGQVHAPPAYGTQAAYTSQPQAYGAYCVPGGGPAQPYGAYPAPGGAYPAPGGAYPAPGGVYPTPGGVYPPPGGAYPAPGGGYPAPGGVYPAPGGAYPAPGGVYPLQAQQPNAYPPGGAAPPSGPSAPPLGNCPNPGSFYGAPGGYPQRAPAGANVPGYNAQQSRGYPSGSRYPPPGNNGGLPMI